MGLDSVSSPMVAVLGAAAVDTITRVAEFPLPDGIVFADTCVSMPGGSGGNVAEGVARLGYPVRFVGILGDDENGKLLIHSFHESGVDTCATLVVNGQRTATCFIAVNQHGERMIFSLGGAALYDEPENLQPEWLNDVKILYIADAFPRVARAALGHLHPDAQVVFNPGGLMIAEGLAHLRPLLSRVQVLITNQLEAEMLTGESDVERAVQMLAELVPAAVIVTLGANGSLLCANGNIIHDAGVPTPNVVDTTGAGDAYAAGVIAGLLEGYDWKMTLNLASEVAAIKIQHFGSRPGLPLRNQVRLLAGGDRPQWTGRKR